MLVLLASCKERKEKIVTPWGEVIGEGDSLPKQGNFTLSDILSNGELIVLTMSGPETYYDYHGRGMGLQYLWQRSLLRKWGSRFE